MKFFAIKHHGEKVRWFQLTGVDDKHPDGTSWTLVDEFNRLCMLDEEQAKAFMRKPGIDPRFRSYRIAGIDFLSVKF